MTSRADPKTEFFPGANPHPVMRVSADGDLIYANPASGPLLEELGLRVGQPVPPPWLERIQSASWADRCPSGSADVRAPRRPLAGPRLHERLRHGRHSRAGDHEVPRPEPEPGLPPVDGRRRSCTSIPPARELIAGVGGQVGAPLPQPLCGDAASRRTRGAAAGWCRSRVAAETTPCSPSTCRSSSSRTSTAPT